MQLSIKQLRKLIREEIEYSRGDYPGDGTIPVLSPDELGLNENGTIFEIVDVVTIGAGVALGIAAVWGGTKLAGAAKSILGTGLKIANRMAHDEINRIAAEADEEIQVVIDTHMRTTIDNDPNIDRLVAEYQELTYKVQRAPKEGGIKGLRGSEFANIRKQQKAKAKELADYLDKVITEAWENIDPAVMTKREKVRNIQPYALDKDVSNATARKYARRSR